MMLASPGNFARSPHFSFLASPPRFLDVSFGSSISLGVMQVAVGAYVLGDGFVT